MLRIWYACLFLWGCTAARADELRLTLAQQGAALTGTGAERAISAQALYLAPGRFALSVGVGAAHRGSRGTPFLETEFGWQDRAASYAIAVAWARDGSIRPHLRLGASGEWQLCAGLDGTVSAQAIQARNGTTAVVSGGLRARAGAWTAHLAGLAAIDDGKRARAGFDLRALRDIDDATTLEIGAAYAPDLSGADPIFVRSAHVSASRRIGNDLTLRFALTHEDSDHDAPRATASFGLTFAVAL